MSKFFVICLCILSFRANSQESDEVFPDVRFDEPMANNAIYALNYIPEYKTFALRLRVQGHTEDLDWNENGGIKRKAEGSGIGFKFMYSMFKKGTFYVESDYASVDKFVYTQGTSTSQNKERGSSDTTFGFLWRMMYQNNDPFSLDLELSFSPSAGKAKRGGSSGNGNRLRGGKKTGAKLNLTRQFKYIEYQVYLSIDNQQKYQELNSSNAMTNFDSFTNKEYGAAMQYETTKGSFMQLGMRRINFGEGAFRINAANKMRPSRLTGIWLKFGSMIDKDKTLLSLILDYKGGKSVLVNGSGTKFNAQYKDLAIALEVLMGNF